MKTHSFVFVFFAALFFSIKTITASLQADLSSSFKATTFPGKISRPGFSHNVKQGFIENKGQVFGYDGLPHPEVKFAFQQGNTQIFLLEKGIAYQFTKTHYPEGYTALTNDKTGAGKIEKLQTLQKEIRTETYRMDMVLSGANPNARISTEGQSEDFINYYNHNVLDVHHYGKIIYHEIYPGIDWVIYTSNGEIKYDFVVRRGADPSIIKLDFKHQEKLSLDENGSFSLKNRMGSITEKKPESFQNGKAIKTAFRLTGSSLSFILGSYDKNNTLVIDPSVSWATYYGGAGDETYTGCATDALGNVYLGGTTHTALNIASGGFQNTYAGTTSNPAGGDAYLVKFNSSGIRQWGTYYGGSGSENGSFCCTDPSGNIYLVGNTSSSSNIAYMGHQSSYGGGGDGFIVKFSTSGARLWGSYYGDYNTDFSLGCTTDASGNVYMTGMTQCTANIASGGFQNTHGGNNDAFLVKFNSSGVRQWATYYGGPANESGYCCAVDASGNTYLTGETQSTSGIASGGFQNTYGGSFNDCFLVKFNAAGARLWATYYGDTGPDYANSCAVDVSGNIYISGITSSSLGIASGGHQNSLAASLDAFLVKFNSSGSRLWGTYYGDLGREEGRSCMTDASGNVYLCGQTSSTVNIASGGFQNTYGGGGTGLYLGDAFLAKFNAGGTRLWATYYGGPGDDYPFNCVLDPSDNIYIAGQTNSTLNIGSGGHQNSFGGVNDAFLVKICQLNTPAQTSAISGNTLVCNPGTQSYSVSTVAGATGYTWILPGIGWNGTSSTNTISSTVGSNGIISVAATNACSTGPSQTISVTYNPALISVNSGSICSGQSFTIIPGGASSYTFSGGSAIVSPVVSTSYSVTGTTSLGCVSASAAVVNVTVNALPVISVNSGSICSGQGFTIAASGAAFYNYPGGSDVVFPTSNTSYPVAGVSNAGCVSAVPAVAHVTVVASPVVSVNSGSICNGQSFTMVPTGADSYSYSGGSAIVTPAASTSYSVTGTSTAGCVSSNTVISNVAVVASPTLNLISPGMVICRGKDLTIAVYGATSYTWRPGSNANTAIISPAATTVYSVTGMTNGCTSTSVFTVTVDACTGISTINTGKGAFNVYPNPNKGVFTITSANFENTQLSLYNLLGEKITYAFMPSSTQEQYERRIDISQLAGGVYMLVIQQQDKTISTIKIIKE